MNENEISRLVLDSAIRVHKQLGPGLLESTYEECLHYELSRLGLYIEKQKSLPLVYDEVRLEAGYRIDLMIESKVIVEVKLLNL